MLWGRRCQSLSRSCCCPAGRHPSPVNGRSSLGFSGSYGICLRNLLFSCSTADYLDVWDVNMLKEPEEVNKQQHHTDRYANEGLIVRRGQEFQISITFNRPHDPSKDQFALEFVIGATPQYSKGTYIPVFPSEERNKLWGGRVLDTSDNVLTMGILPRADCIVGKYGMYVAVVTPYGIRRTKKDPSRELYILFNPWVKDDSVYLEDGAERTECVLNELGIIYHGAYDDVSERSWNYGQFEFGILDACLFIMDKGALPITNRGDPVKIARKASAMINSKDDEGVLVGNWSGDYMYGVAPTSWTGSVEILLSYANGGDPVCYAQCWVYAAVFNTFLRCLGIPARVVTNFFSAHDNDGNLKTDILLDENGKVDRSRTRDSIWNYHCWNECYMARLDLPEGFGGWQVVDATPQETSDGMYRCGPASVYAIKHGMVCYPFDAPFVFAEVNSDVVFYQRSRDGTLTPVKVNTSHVGRLVLTKAPGSNGRSDITSMYKFPEGSAEERTVLEKAEEYGVRRQDVTPPVADVALDIPSLEVKVGAGFDLALDFRNSSGQRRVFTLHSLLLSEGEVIVMVRHCSTAHGDTVKRVLCIYPSPWVSSGHHDRPWIQKSDWSDGSCLLQVAGTPRVSEEMLVTVQFTNDFKFSLENVHVRVEGPGVMVRLRESFIPRRQGPSKLMASLDCHALRQVRTHTHTHTHTHTFCHKSRSRV
uniref:protein-glutamine gamma-glutamyltransferase n=1 Tax=Denticeps clupeoides TaxID=299321 RepID=A0AAY4CDG8_9TELE